MRKIEFKTSVALALSDLNVTPKKLHELVGREKPVGQHHMRYTPADLRTARYRAAGVPPDQELQLLPPHSDQPFPPLIVTRMTKGGVGKTSTSINLAAVLAMMGYRILFIDADPQASATNLLGVDGNLQDDLLHIGHFLTKKPSGEDTELASAIIPIYADGGLDLIPADITMSQTDANMVTIMASHQRALQFLTRNGLFLSRRYDAIIVDTAPGTTPMGLAFAFAAKVSGKILTVVEPEGTCLRALESLASNLAEIKEVTGAQIGMEVVINKYHVSLKHIRENMGVLYSKYGEYLNDTIIPQFTGFAKQMDPNNKVTMPLVESDPSSVGSAAIISLAKSIILSFGIHHPGLRNVAQEKTA